MTDIITSRMNGLFLSNVGSTAHTPLMWVAINEGVVAGLRERTLLPANCDWKGSTLYIDSLVLSREDIRAVICASQEAAAEGIQPLLLGLDPANIPVPPLEAVLDDRSNHYLGFSFLREPKNAAWVDDCKRRLAVHIQADGKQHGEWIRNGVINIDRRRQYEEARIKFLGRLLAAVHMTSGQPVRRPQILGLRWENTLEGSLRNVFVGRGRVLVRTIGGKSMAKVGEQVVWRSLPTVLSRIVVIYLATVIPFSRALDVSSGNTDPGINPFLFAKGPLVGGAGQFPDDSLTKNIKDVSVATISQSINVKTWRHICIAFGLKFIPHSTVIDDEDADDPDTIMHAMSGHSAQTGMRVYAREQGTSDNFELFLSYSTTWQRFWNIGSGQATKHDMEEMDGDVMSREQQESRRVDGPELFCDEMLQNMFRRADAQLRNHQREVLEAIGMGGPILYVAGVGGGKTLAFALPAYAQPDGMTVVIQPLRSLLADTAQRLREWGIKATVWEGAEPEGSCSVLLVAPESLGSHTWTFFINRQRDQYRIDRVVLDEAQEVLVSEDFRATGYDTLKAKMDNISDTQIFMTGTLPFALESRFMERMGLDPDLTQVIRMVTTPRNIRFEWRDTRSPTTLIQQLCRQLDTHQRQKALVYVDTIDNGTALKADFGWPFYHARDRNTRQRAEMFSAWVKEGGVMVATCALGLGVDFHSVVLVICWNPRSLMDMVQMFGRAGRDGSPATGVMVSSRPIEADLRRYCGRECRREVISLYLDDKKGVCGLGHNRCDICSPNKDAITTPIAPGSVTTRGGMDESPLGVGMTSAFGAMGVTTPQTVLGNPRMASPSSGLVRGARAMSSVRTGLSPVGRSNSLEVHSSLFTKIQAARAAGQGVYQPPRQTSIGRYLQQPQPQPQRQQQYQQQGAPVGGHRAAEYYLVMRQYHDWVVKTSSLKICICCLATGQGHRTHYLRSCNGMQEDEDLAPRINSSRYSKPGLGRGVCWMCFVPLS